MNVSLIDRKDPKEFHPDSRIGSTSGGLVWLVYLGLAVVTLAVYWQVYDFEFVNCDDGIFVSQNPHVASGLTKDSLAWSFGIHGPGQWHPMAWWVHQLTCHVFGLNSGAHHLVNVLVHVAATLVLLTSLWQLTGDFWPSTLVAALLAIHPLSVESVAWISHLREPLSMLFWGLVMWSYAVYARRGGIGRYLVVLFLFTLGLMAKPTLMTLPCVLLLLDWWPLNRISWGTSNTEAVANQRPLGQLVIEKLPLMALALVSVVMAYLCQKTMGSIVSLERHPFGARMANAAQSYVLYLRNMIWPLNLAPIYPLQKSFHPAMIGSALLLLAVITVSAFYFRQRRRYLLVGWLWYLGTLVPVIGLLKMGELTAMTDHYAYVSLLGIYIAIAWLLADWIQRQPKVQPMVIGVVATLLLLLLPITWRQIGFWRNSGALWQHTLAVTNDNCVAHNNIGLVFQAAGRYPESLEHFEKSLRINPNNFKAHNNIGNALKDLGRPQNAFAHYDTALEINPQYADAHFNYGLAMQESNRLQEAVNRYQKAIEIRPDHVMAHNNCGIALKMLNRPQDAIEHFQKAIKIKPNHVMAYYNQGIVLQQLNRPEEAIMRYQEALRIKPDYAEAHNNWGYALRMLNRPQEAIEHYQEAVRIDPDFAEAHNNLGNVLQSLGRPGEAVDHYQEAVRIKPDYFEAYYNGGVALQEIGRPQESLSYFQQAERLRPEASEPHYRLAWLLATSPEDEIRDGDQAIQHARRALEIVGGNHPVLLDTLAAAHAEARQFAEAVQWQEKAVGLATGKNKQTFRARLELYRQDRPFRESK